MTTLNMTQQPRAQARMAGLLYLIIAVTGGFSIGYMPDIIVIDGDPLQTFQNLMDHQTLFKWGIAGDMAVLLMEVILTVLLYQLYKSVNQTHMTIATYSRMAMAIIMGFNLINYMIPSIMMMQANTLSAIGNEALASQAYIFLKAHKYGELAWQLFFAVHLFTLGYVVKQSGKGSKWMGIAMLVGGIGYGGDSFIQFIMNDSAILSGVFSALLVCAVIGELWFAIWLLAKGGKDHN